MNNKQTFVIIMSAGRCASTSTMNFLNTSEDFHIYGENHSFILSLLDSIHNLNQLLLQHNQYRTHHIKEENYVVYTTNKKYLKNAFFYDDINNLVSIKDSLFTQIQKFFHTDKKYIGFKEIRWLDSSIKNISILENLYNKVLYIHLTRNTDEQITSLKKTFMKGQSIDYINNYIKKTNNNITNFIADKKDRSISINISEDINFLEIIKNFILKNNASNENWENIFD